MSRATTPSAPPAEVSYDDYMAMPESTLSVEVVDGVLIDMPTPSYSHQDVQLAIAVPLRAHVRANGLGLIVVSPADLVIRRKPKLRIRQPDVMFFSDARSGFDCAADPNRLQAESVAPEIAVEVLFPGQNERTLAEKLRDYASINVLEVWFADQLTRSIRVLRPDGESYMLEREYRSGDRLTSPNLPGLDLPVASIFG